MVAMRRSVYVAAGMLILVIFASCNRNNEQNGQDNGAPYFRAEKPAVQSIAVSAVMAVSGELNDYIHLSGDVEADTQVNVFADTAGKVSRLYVDLGQLIDPSQIIAEIDPSRPGQNFAASPVYSPIRGVVTRIDVSVGDTVAPSVPIVEVSRTDTLIIRTAIAERFISKVALGRKALAQFDAWPGQSFSARVVELSPVVNPLNRTLEIELDFDQPDSRIKPGMYADLRLITETKTDLVKLPAQAIVERFGNNYVFIIQEDNTVEQRLVSVGITIDDKAEVISGLAAGEQVVYKGQTLLEDGTLVRVVETSEPLTGEDSIQ